MKNWGSIKKLKVLALCLVIYVPILIGCSRPHPNPENMDPIYLDLVQRAQEAERAYQEELSTSKKAYLAIQSGQVNTLDLKIAKNNWLKSRQKLPRLEQNAKFLAIQAERRRVEGRLSYRLAFERGEEWPDPREYDLYRVHRSLRDAPQSWDHRVPSNIHRYSKNELFHVEPKN